MRLTLQAPCDAIFCGHLNAAPLAALLARAWGTKFWLQVHGVEAWAARGPLTRRSIECADLVTSVSRFTRQRLLQWTGLPPDRVRVLPNTVSRSFAPRPKREDLVVRHDLKGRRVILTVGRLAKAERYKGQDRIIRVLPSVAERFPDVTYLIVGSGDDHMRLADLARECGVASRVVFAGHVDDKELPDYFALADIYAMPSTGEGFGIAFLEAAMSGLAVVGGSRDGSVDALADGVIGAPVDPNDLDALTAALVSALSGKKTVSSSVQRFAFENFAHHVDELLRSLAR